MALAVGPAATLARPTLPRWPAAVASLAVCVGGVLVLVPPALSAVAPTTGGSRVTATVLGDISTTGLPETAAVSTVVVRNDGATPLSWSARPSATGDGAAGVLVQAWLPLAGACLVPTQLLGPAHWSSAPLAPGASTQVCVRVASTGTAAGSATPHLTIAARPA